MQELAPFGSCKKIWKEFLSLSISLSIYVSTNNKVWALFVNKMRDMFLKRMCFVRSLYLITFPLVSVLQYIYIYRERERERRRDRETETVTKREKITKT